MQNTILLRLSIFMLLFSIATKLSVLKYVCEMPKCLPLTHFSSSLHLGSRELGWPRINVAYIQFKAVKFRFKSTGLVSDSLHPFWYTTICHTHICMVRTLVNFCIISSQQMRKSISSPQSIGSSHL